MTHSPRPENPPNLPRPRDTNLKSVGIAFADLRATLRSSHCRKMLRNYSASLTRPELVSFEYVVVTRADCPNLFH